MLDVFVLNLKMSRLDQMRETLLRKIRAEQESINLYSLNQINRSNVKHSRLIHSKSIHSIPNGLRTSATIYSNDCDTSRPINLQTFVQNEHHGKFSTKRIERSQPQQQRRFRPHSIDNHNQLNRVKSLNNMMLTNVSEIKYHTRYIYPYRSKSRQDQHPASMENEIDQNHSQSQKQKMNRKSSSMIKNCFDDFDGGFDGDDDGGGGDNVNNHLEHLNKFEEMYLDDDRLMRRKLSNPFIVDEEKRSIKSLNSQCKQTNKQDMDCFESSRMKQTLKRSMNGNNIHSRQSSSTSTKLNASNSSQHQCKHCQRKFSSKDRLDKHASICGRISKKHRPIFHSSKQRNIGLNTTWNGSKLSSSSPSKLLIFDDDKENDRIANHHKVTEIDNFKSQVFLGSHWAIYGFII